MTFFGPDIRNGVAVGLGSTAGFKSRAFAPNVLFAQGEQGFWYDPSDIPVNWRRNLLTRTEEFDNAAWAKSQSSVTPDTVVAPDRTTTADSFIANGVSTNHRITQTVAAGFERTFSVYVKAGTQSLVQLFFGADTAPWANFNLATGVVGSTGSNQTASITDVGSGWYRCSIYTSSLTATDASIGFISAINSSRADANTLTTTMYIWGAQLERASTASDYQRIVTPEISFLDYQPQPVMYTDSAGTTPVTAVEQAVGLILDKIRGLVLGPELITNGGPSFVNTTGWSATGSATVSIVGGNLRITRGATAGAQTATIQYTGAVIGGGYFMTVAMAANSANINTTVQSYGNTTLANSATVGGSPTRTIFYNADRTNPFLIFRLETGSSGDYVDISLASVKAIAGNHAIQPTAASRPTLRARYNLLTYSEQFDNAAWTKLNTTVTANSTQAPDGTTTADTLVETAASGVHRVSQSFTPPVTGSHTTSIYAKASTRSWLVIQNDFGANNTQQWFDLALGSVGGQAGAGGTASITLIGNGWYRCTLTTVATTTGAGNVNIYVTDANNNSSYLGDGTSGIFIWGADLRRSSDTYLPYQRIAAATDYDTVGFPVYLAFDGSDDSLYTGGSIDFSATDKMTVFAGVTKLSDATRGIVVELGNNAAAGGFHINAPHADANATFSFTSTGTIFSGHCLGTPYAAPQTRVLTGIGDIAADVANLQVDGTLFTNSNDQGSGNYSNAALYIGRRNNATLPFNGRLYQLIGRGVTTSAALIQQAERWIAGKQGRTL